MGKKLYDKSENKVYFLFFLGAVPHYGRELAEFRGVPGVVFEAVAKRYVKDFEMYGYGYTRRNNGSVTTECVLQCEDGSECC